MTRSELTKKLTNNLHNQIGKQSFYSVMEVSMIDRKDGNRNYGRVDYLVYENLKTWKFFEIKSCEEDFHSDSKWTFLGHYNYFVMPYELFLKVEKDIPDFVGVYALKKGRTNLISVKKAKKQKLPLKEKIYLDRMITSLSRDAHKYYKLSEKSETDQEIKRLQNENARLKRELKRTTSEKINNGKERRVFEKLLLDKGYKKEDLDTILNTHL